MAGNSLDTSAARFGAGQVAWRATLLLGAIVGFLGAVGINRPALWMLIPLLPGILVCRRFSEARTAMWHFLTSRWRALASDSPVDGSLRLQAALILVTLPAAFLFLTSKWLVMTGDTWPVVPTACGIVRQSGFDLAWAVPMAPRSYYLEETNLPYCTLQASSGVYSSYPQGMVLFALPSAAAQALTGGHLVPATLQRIEKWTAAWLAAMSLGLFFLLAVRLSDPGTAWLATALLAIGSVFLTTLSQCLWQHGGTVFWSLLVLWIEFQPGVRSTRLGMFAQGLALALLFACRLSGAIFIVCFGTWLLCREVRRALLVAGISAICYLPWIALHATLYGNLFGPSMGQAGDSAWGSNPVGGLLGVLVSPSRGLLVYQPWLVLVPLGIWLTGRGTLRDSAVRGWSVFVLIFALLHTLLVANWGAWDGGHCWGSRLLSEIVPFLLLLALPALAWLRQSRSGAVVLGVFFLLALILHVREFYFPAFWDNVQTDIPRATRLWSWENAPFLTRPLH